MTVKARLNRLIALYEAGVMSESEMLEKRARLALARRG